VNLSSKSRYALKILMHLVYFQSKTPVQRKDIAQRQGIPADYLDQILLKLRQGGLIVSIRGRGGGYKLSKRPAEISVWDMVQAVENHVYPVACQSESDKNCSFEVACVSKSAWQIVGDVMKKSLKALRLADLTEGAAISDAQMCPIGGVRECKQG